jgi:hypothetical protein
MFTDEFDAGRKSAWRNCGAVNEQRTIPPRPCGIGRWMMVYEFRYIAAHTAMKSVYISSTRKDRGGFFFPICLSCFPPRRLRLYPFGPGKNTVNPLCRSLSDAPRSGFGPRRTRPASSLIECRSERRQVRYSSR